MLKILYYSRFSCRHTQRMPLKIGHKVTTIFFNRYYFIKKLTLSPIKNSVSSRKKGTNHGKKIGFRHIEVTKCRYFCQNSGKFPNYDL